MKKSIFASMALLIICSCSSNKNSGSSDSDEAVDIKAITTGLQGKWRLSSYRIDCASVELNDSTDYILTLDESDDTFGLTTDCNSIGGEFGVTHDTIRFRNMMVTEMACDNMTVEENMLRLLNDAMAFAICKGDTIIFSAPQVGLANFVRKQ